MSCIGGPQHRQNGVIALSLRLVVRLSIDSCLAESRRTKRQCELARQSKILAYVSKFEIKKSAKRPGNQVPNPGTP